VVLVGPLNCQARATLFQAPQHGRSAGRTRSTSLRLPRRPYKFLDPSAGGYDLFYGRDRDLAQLQSAFEASRVLILCGLGHGKTHCFRQDCSRACPRAVCVGLVRMVDNEPQLP